MEQGESERRERPVGQLRLKADFDRIGSILWSGVDIWRPIQIVLDKKLLLAADQAARRTNRNCSALMRDALRVYLQRVELKDREARDRAGYLEPELPVTGETFFTPSTLQVGSSAISPTP